MIDHSLTKKLIIFLAILNMFLLASYIFVYYKVNASEDAAATIYSEIGINEQGKRNFTDLKQTVEETAPNRQKLEGYFIKQDGIVAFLDMVESLGDIATTSVHLTSVNKQGKGDDKFLEIALEATGSFHNVYYFASLLETLPYKTHFTKVFFEKNVSAGGHSFSPSGNTGVREAPGSGTGDQDVEDAGTNSGSWKVTIVFDLLSFLSNE